MSFTDHSNLIALQLLIAVNIPFSRKVEFTSADLAWFRSPIGGAK